MIVFENFGTSKNKIQFCVDLRNIHYAVDCSQFVYLKGEQKKIKMCGKLKLMVSQEPICSDYLKEYSTVSFMEGYLLTNRYRSEHRYNFIDYKKRHC